MRVPVIWLSYRWECNLSFIVCDAHFIRTFYLWLEKYVLESQRIRKIDKPLWWIVACQPKQKCLHWHIMNENVCGKVPLEWMGSMYCLLVMKIAKIPFKICMLVMKIWLWHWASFTVIRVFNSAHSYFSSRIKISLYIRLLFSFFFCIMGRISSQIQFQNAQMVFHQIKIPCVFRMNFCHFGGIFFAWAWHCVSLKINMHQ